ncbi:subtilase [Colletotrichum graminicola M1.001]|uniref:Subtilase n=1 Tax=Colletotrichum graminicola (strain M1.001 / M2 / FGSC 10212) TaxID=645133 RepID=E3QZZ7_COLGM|nr:subtilase [Colletotrichum graminicola M1.001]EFQ36435.1 subtilase [Colletotrichum graminicola M1.001]
MLMLVEAGGAFLSTGPGLAAAPYAAGAIVAAPVANALGQIDMAKVAELPDIPDEPKHGDPEPTKPQVTPTTRGTPSTTTPDTTSTTAPGTTSTTVSSSSAPTPTEPPVPYVVVSNKELTREAGTDLQNRMRPYAVGPIQVHFREDEQGPQTMIFLFTTTPTLAKDLELLNDADIGWVFPESDIGDGGEEPFPPSPSENLLPLITKPDLVAQGILVDPVAATSLMTLSQPPEFASYNPDDMPGYAYPESAGKGVTVYIIDTGATPTHDEYKQSPGNKRWIFIDENTSKSDSDLKSGHGTCVQSLVNGPRFGAAKEADIVIVKLPDSPLVSDIVMALYWVTDDIAARNLEGKAVVTMSVLLAGVDMEMSKAFGTQILKDGWDAKMESLRDQMELLIYLDVPVVAASGNLRRDYEHIDTFPGIFATDMDVIAVGAMNANGLRTSYSQGDIDEVTVLAMGEVDCARRDRDYETRHAFGTSFAAPRVAGMIATWLSSDRYRERLQVKGKVAANVKSLLKELAYVKMPASKSDGGYPSNFYNPAGHDSYRI